MDDEIREVVEEIKRTGEILLILIVNGVAWAIIIAVVYWLVTGR